MILATGGFGADFTDDSLLAKYRPDLLHLPTTNGDHTTGELVVVGSLGVEGGVEGLLLRIIWLNIS